MQAMSGMMLMSGSAEDAEPIKVGFPLIDSAAGILAALSIVVAIAGRQNIAAAQHIDSSMLLASLTLMYPSASAYLTDGIEPQRLGNRGYTGSPTADTYRCRDGWLAVGANTPKQFRTFSEILDLSDLCTNENLIDLVAFNSPGSAFVIAKNYMNIKQKFQDALASKSAYEMEIVLNRNSVPAARVRTLGEFLGELNSSKSDWHPTIFNSVSSEVRTTGLGFKNNEYEADEKLNRFAPTLGQDNDEILKELGYSTSYINNLRKNGIVS
jgi:crotonobetainyl-CoA:carnitine CoA-transferase CaiB-like acyl-CoA transferase